MWLKASFFRFRRRFQAKALDFITALIFLVTFFIKNDQIQRQVNLAFVCRELRSRVTNGKKTRRKTQ
jgi:hypothetical protein